MIANGVEIHPWQLGVNLSFKKGRLRIDFPDAKPEVWRRLREGEEMGDEWVIYHGVTWVPLMQVRT